MTHYIIWDKNYAPESDQEKYVWYNDNVCKIWDGYEWRTVNTTNGVLDERVIPDTIVRKSDLINIIKRLYSEGALVNPDDSSQSGNWATIDALDDKLNKSEFNSWKNEVIAPALNTLSNHGIRITNLEADVNSLKSNTSSGSGTGTGGNSGETSNNFTSGRVFLLYAKTAGPSIKPNKPSPNLIWDVNNNRLSGDFRAYTTTGEIIQWNTNNVNPQKGEYVWISVGNFSYNGNLIGEWSDPFCITSGGRDGQDGRNGVDGVNMEFIYKRVTTLEQAYAEDAPNNYDVDAPFIDDWHDDQNGWYDHPNGITSELPIELVSFRKKLDDGSGNWGPFSDPVIWAKWGDDGTDGDGVEYIFLVVGTDDVIEVNTGNGITYHLNNNTLLPPRSEQELLSVLPITGVTAEELKEDFQQDEWVPGNNKQSIGWDRNWTDEPLDVSSWQPFEFVSIRKWDHDTNTWDYFSEPVLWNKFAYVSVTGFTAFAFTRTDKLIGNYVPEGGTSFNPIPTQTRISANGTIDNTIQWYDSVPSGNNPVWMTTRIFGDGDENQGWSSPRRLSDSAGFQVEYSKDYPWDTRPILPKVDEIINNTQPFLANNDEGFNEVAWRTYCSNQNPSLGTWGDDDIVKDPVYMATCYKKQNGDWSNWSVSKIKGEAGQNGRSVLSTTMFYKAFASDVNVTSPLTTATLITDPNTGTSYIGTWASDPNDLLASLTEELTRLWSFTRIVYDDDTIWHSSPACIRYYNDQMSVDYSEIRAQAEAQINADLQDATTRLGQINDTDTYIKTEGGLTQLLNTYCSGNKRSFADFIADAASATINQNVGLELGDSLTNVKTRLNAAEGKLTNAVTTETLNGKINDARTEWSDAITSTVTKAKNIWVWQGSAGTISGTSVTNGQTFPYAADSGITKKNTNETFSAYETRIKNLYTGTDTSNKGFASGLTTIADEMSAIKQESGQISLLVGNNGQLKAGIQIIADDNNIESNGSGGSRIVLDATNIRLNGNVIANAIKSNAIEIGNNQDPSSNILIGNNTITAPGFSLSGTNGLSITGGSITIPDPNDANNPFFIANSSGVNIKGNLSANSLNTGTTSGLNTEIVNGKLSIKDGNKVKAEFGLNNSNELILKFYPPQGKYDAVNNPNGSVTAQYDLGPDGLKDVATVFSPNWTAMIGTKMSGNTVANWFSGSGDLFNHWGVVLENGTMKSTYGTDQTSSFIFNPTTLQLYKYEDGYWQIGNNNNTRQYINPLSNDPRLINSPSSINGNYFKSVGEFPLSQTWLGNNRPDSGYYYIGKGKPISGGTSPSVWPYFISNRFEADYVYYNNQTYTTGKLTYDFCTQFSGSDPQNCTIDFWIQYVSRT